MTRTPKTDDDCFRKCHGSAKTDLGYRRRPSAALRDALRARGRRTELANYCCFRPRATRRRAVWPDPSDFDPGAVESTGPNVRPTEEAALNTRATDPCTPMSVARVLTLPRSVRFRRFAYTRPLTCFFVFHPATTSTHVIDPTAVDRRKRGPSVYATRSDTFSQTPRVPFSPTAVGPR